MILTLSDMESPEAMPRPSLVVYVGPDPSMRGGMATVARVLTDAGFFADPVDIPFPIVFHASVGPGSRWGRARDSVVRCWHFMRRRFPPGTVVHLNTASGASFYRKSVYVLLSRLKRASVLLHIHPDGFVDFFDARAPANRTAIRWIIRRCVRVLALTERVRHFAEQECGVKCELAANPVPLPPRRSDQGRSSSRPVVLFAGAFVEAKGVWTLIQSAALLRTRGISFELAMFGSGSVDELQTAAASAGLESCVSVSGWIEPPAMREQMANADVFVLPSDSEGMPMVILEAMSVGLPVVSCPVGAIPSIVSHGISGLLVRPRNPEELAAALERLLTDRNLAQRMGEAGRVRATEFDPSRVGRELRRIYISLARDRTSSGVGP